MTACLKQSRHQAGQSLIEIVITIGLLAILFHAVFTLITAAFRVLGDSRARLTARHLTQTKIEEIKNVPFDDLGTVGGIPPGIIPQSETITRNGLDYTVTTSIIYIDDEFDGLAPSDPLATDYKRVRVETSWSGLFTSAVPVVMLTDIAPQGLESTGSGGTIVITVFDANAQPVPETDIEIKNSLVSPEINLNIRTDANGRAIFPGAPACATCYYIKVSKSDFTSDQTYSSAEVTNPLKPYLTVIEDSVSEISFTIDRVSTLTVQSFGSREDGFPPAGSINFHLRGSKIIGTDSAAMPVYLIDEDYTTGEDGQLILEDMVWDRYELNLTDSALNLTGTNPLSPFLLVAGTELDLLMSTSEHQDNTLLLNIIDTNDNPIASAGAHLTQAGNFDEFLFTGQAEEPDFGQAFFSPLDIAEYNYEATASGFQTNSGAVEVDSQTSETIILQPE